MENTVADQLKEFAIEQGIPLEEYVEVWLGARIESSVPERYKRLIREVALRLPEGWDDHAEWSVELGWRKTSAVTRAPSDSKRRPEP